MLRRYKLKNYNFRLVILLIAISIIGVLLIGSADSADQKKQAIGVVLGVVIMIIVSLLDYSWLLNFYWVLYIGNLMMLGVLYLGGSTAKNTFGATRWIQIGSFQFQPTELSKIFLIMFFAMFLMKHEEDLNTAKTIFYRDRASDSAARYDLPSAGFEKYDYGHGSVLLYDVCGGLKLQSYRRCSGFRFSTGTCASACHYAGEFPASGGS
jgi:Bacterial cell division membrane protein